MAVTSTPQECGCTILTYTDGCLPEIVRCDLHRRAGEIYDRLRDVLLAGHPQPDHTDEQQRLLAEVWQDARTLMESVEVA